MNWKQKVLAATRGSQLGAIFACVFGEDIPAPKFSGKASITSDGFVMCNFTASNGDGHLGAFVGSLDDLAGNVSRLADHLKLKPAERREYGDAIASWIGSDYSGGAAARLAKAAKGEPVDAN